MVATVSVYFDWGGADNAPVNHTDIDLLGPPTLKFKLADNANIDQNNKLVIPNAGLGPYYSFGKHIYLYLDDLGGSTSISNIKLYSDGTNSLGTGVDILIGTNVCPERYTTGGPSYAGYDLAEFKAGSTLTSDLLETWHTDITTSASIFTYTVAAPFSVTISEAGNIMDLATETSNYVVMQMSVANTASVGTTATETFYFSYDEA